MFRNEGTIISGRVVKSTVALLLTVAALDAQTAGTPNAIVKYTATGTTQTSSSIYQNGGFFGFNNPTPWTAFDFDTGDSQSVTGLAVEGADAHNVIFRPSTCAGCANPNIQAGWASLIYTNAAADTGNLFLGPWGNSGGLAMDGNGNATFFGNLTVKGSLTAPAASSSTSSLLTASVGTGTIAINTSTGKITQCYNTSYLGSPAGSCHMMSQTTPGASLSVAGVPGGALILNKGTGVLIFCTNSTVGSGGTCANAYSVAASGALILTASSSGAFILNPVSDAVVQCVSEAGFPTVSCSKIAGGL